MEYVRTVQEEEPTTKTRQPWSKDEDTFLSQSVQTYGVGHWASIATSLKERTGIARTPKQCRNRWVNSLDPNVTKQDWTAEEEDHVFQLHKQFGNKWAEIAKHIPGRTENSVKNHWYSTLRRKLRKLYKFIGGEINKDSKLRQDAIDFTRIDYRKYMESKNMKKSDITIVCQCVEYMQPLDMHGDLAVKEAEQNKLIAGFGNYGENIYHNHIPEGNHENYDAFIQNILQLYQDCKQEHTPYAPDVQYASIKMNHANSDEDAMAMSPFVDNGKFSGVLANLPAVHHTRVKRARRTPDEAPVSMVPNLMEVYEHPIMTSAQPLAMPMQMLPQASLHGLNVISSMPMQTVQMQPMPMPILSQMQILPQMPVMQEPMAEAPQEGQPELQALPAEREGEITTKTEVGAPMLMPTASHVEAGEPERVPFQLNAPTDENGEMSSKRVNDLYI